MSSCMDEDEKSTHLIGYNNSDLYNGMVGFINRPSSSSMHGGLIGYQQDFSNPQIMHDCVFPCEGNERPSHGLSLSLNSGNPSAIGLQSFELRQGQPEDYVRFGQSSFVRGSMYLVPAQELLNEFCNLRNDNIKMKGVERNFNIDDVQMQSLNSLGFLDLQTRKSKLLQMLEELDRRYKHYCDQMRSVVSSFETFAGHGSATAYSALASKAMSRHFRSLKDGITREIKATRKAMGEKDGSVSGVVRGETPRLRVLDQTFRQQRARQVANMEIQPWRPQRGLPERSVSILRAWLFEHFLHPYPSDVDKHILARQTGLSRSQVSNWFINARVRLWKPMVEEMYLEELKEDHQPQNDAAFEDPPPYSDQKPTHDQLVRMESDCLSNMMNNNGNQHDAFGDNSFGGEFDFSSYGNNSAGVSLTLGLQNGGGMNMGFSDGMEDNQYSLMEGEGGQNLPYRNLMGAQLLQ